MELTNFTLKKVRQGQNKVVANIGKNLCPDPAFVYSNGEFHHIIDSDYRFAA